MVSNGRNVSSAGYVSGTGVGNAHTEVQRQWVDETGILLAAWNRREELLLLAQEAVDADGRVCCTSAGAVRAGSDYGRCAPAPVPGSGTEIAGWCGYRCRCSLAPLYSVAMIDLTKVRNYYVACGYTDLRRGIDGLAVMVQRQFRLDPFTNTLFLFCIRRGDRIKALYWEGNGFVLLCKQLESDSFQ